LIKHSQSHTSFRIYIQNKDFPLVLIHGSGGRSPFSFVVFQFVSNIVEVFFVSPNDQFFDIALPDFLFGSK
jgi:hypothetical protein